jgi:hypothetical protein
MEISGNVSKLLIFCNSLWLSSHCGLTKVSTTIWDLAKVMAADAIFLSPNSLFFVTIQSHVTSASID